jgi:hypothetical protein
VRARSKTPPRARRALTCNKRQEEHRHRHVRAARPHERHEQRDEAHAKADGVHWEVGAADRADCGDTEPDRTRAQRDNARGARLTADEPRELVLERASVSTLRVGRTHVAEPKRGPRALTLARSGERRRARRSTRPRARGPSHYRHARCRVRCERRNCLISERREIINARVCRGEHPPDRRRLRLGHAHAG